MSKIEVLVTTMKQTDFSKYHQMNIQTDAVIANQIDKNDYVETNIEGNVVKLISTDSIGVSRNRNIALVHADQKSEFVLFADDDLIFNDGYEQEILNEFEKHPYADGIKFNIHDLSSSRKICMKKIKQFEKATRLNMSSSGVWGLAIKKDVLNRYNLFFDEHFGPGTPNYCGEDTIFFMEMLKKGVHLYRSPVDIAGIDQTDSCWFNGHDEHFFSTAGKVMQVIYPKLSYLIVIRSAFRAYRRNDSGMSFVEILACYYKGIRTYDT